MFLLVAPSLSRSATINVPGSQPTIQAGINAAANGDTVLVAAGTYVGPANRNLDFLGKGILLRSASGAAATIIDCQSAGRGFRFHSNETLSAIVDGFTIRNGNGLGANGGGMSIEGASPAIRNSIFATCQANDGGGAFLGGGAPSFISCQFAGGSAVNSGGAIYGEAQSTPIFRDCAITQNSAAFGGGMYFTASSSITLRGCTFIGNTSVTYGGGIFCRGGALTLDSCSWSQNSAKRGAGIYSIEGASAAIDSCDFTTNTAGEAGGGVFSDHGVSVTVTFSDFTGNRTQLASQPNAGGTIYCNLPGALLIEDCVFTGNTCFGPVGKGGGIFYSGTLIPAEITRCAFHGNSAGWGGGVDIEADNVTVSDCEFLDNTSVALGGGLSGGDSVVRSTFIRNHAGTVGGGIFSQGGGVVIEDCVMADNTAVNVGGGLYRNTGRQFISNVSRSIFHGNSAALGGGVYFLATGQNVLTDCTLFENSAAQGGALYVDQGQPPLGITSLTRCTIASNVAPIGSGLVFEGPAIINQSIIAFGVNGNAVTCFGAGEPALSCTDIFGNAGGNWDACISDQLGINGNFSADPRFCAPFSGDFTLAADSPCAPAHSPAGCGTIGSQPVGCLSPIGIADVAAPSIRSSIRIMPNPLSTTGVIEWANNSSGAIALSLYDTNGRLILRRDLPPESSNRGRLSWREFLSTKHVAPGVYFLRMLGQSRVKLADETVIIIR